MKKNYSLIGIDGNAFSIMGYVRKSMRECGRAKEGIDSYLKEATSGNYDNLLCISINVIEELNMKEK